jgi:hypothetical protein
VKKQNEFSYKEDDEGHKFEGMNVQGGEDDFDEDEFKWDENDDDFDDDAAYEDYTGSMSTSSSFGGSSGGNNQISRKNFAFGPATDKIKDPCIVMMVAEKPSIALSITEALCG